MTLLINLNKDFDWFKTPNSLSILFSQCKVSLCERNTHDVRSLLVNVGENCCSISAQKTTRQVLFTICSQSENTDSDLKVHALHYANELLVRIRLRSISSRYGSPVILLPRNAGSQNGWKSSLASDLPFKNFCKLAKRAETIRNYQKQVLVMIKHGLANSQITSIPE